MEAIILSFMVAAYEAPGEGVFLNRKYLFLARLPEWKIP